MDVILHLGAHRCATASLQAILRAEADALGVTVWGPWRLRDRLSHGLAERPARGLDNKRDIARVQMNLVRAAKRGVRRLVVTDAGLIGSVTGCVAHRALYPQTGERMARVYAGFGPVSRLVLHIRSPESWWASVLAQMVARGMPLPAPDVLDRIVASPRSWQHVITDLACAWPDTEIAVIPYEASGGDPRPVLSAILERESPRIDKSDTVRLNARPDAASLRAIVNERVDGTDLLDRGGIWTPFHADQVAELQEVYADDMFWLRTGADGLATLITDDRGAGSGHTPTASAGKRGRYHDTTARGLAYPRRERAARPPTR